MTANTPLDECKPYPTVHCYTHPGDDPGDSAHLECATERPRCEEQARFTLNSRRDAAASKCVDVP